MKYYDVKYYDRTVKMFLDLEKPQDVYEKIQAKFHDQIGSGHDGYELSENRMTFNTYIGGPTFVFDITPREQGMIEFPDQSKWRPEHGGWCPGKYLQPCSRCGNQYIGAKRGSFYCEPCAYNDLDLLREHLKSGNDKIYYPISRIDGFMREGVPLIDFMKRYSVTFYREGDDGYWQMSMEDYDEMHKDGWQGSKARKQGSGIFG